MRCKPETAIPYRFLHELLRCLLYKLVVEIVEIADCLGKNVKKTIKKKFIMTEYAQVQFARDLCECV